MNCCRKLWPVMCSLLVALALDGCNYGDKNKDPIAGNDTETTARGVAVTINVLANDSDPDGDSFEVVGVTQGANGEVALNDDADAVESRFTDINNRGEISGFTTDDEGVFHPLILTPITPAPNTFFEDTE